MTFANRSWKPFLVLLVHFGKYIQRSVYVLMFRNTASLFELLILFNIGLKSVELIKYLLSK